MFSLFFYVFDFMYFLSEKYYKSITVQYYIANCASWVLRLTLQIGLTDMPGTELVHT